MTRKAHRNGPNAETRSEEINARLRAKYPFAISIGDYIEKMNKGELPRPEFIVRGASWQERPGERTFGFDSTEDLEWFLKKWLGQLKQKGIES